MNDDCLLQIFAVKSLDLLDLSSLAETCKRFQQLVQRVTPSELDVRTVRTRDYPYLVVSKNNSQYSTATNDIKRIFKNFGSSFNAISFTGLGDTEYFLLNQITDHCSQNLKCLRLDHLRIPEILTVKLQTIFKQLQKLELSVVCCTELHQTLFADCHSLVELTVGWVENCGSILENIFPKLERFTYNKRKLVDSMKNPRKEQSWETLSTFISRHSTLKALELDFFSCDEKCKNDILQAICNSCKNLEELFLYPDARRVSPPQPLRALKSIQELKSLRTLKLRYESFVNFEFLSSLSQLRELILGNCRLPSDSNQLATLTQLSKLNICFCEVPVDLDVVGVIRQLVNLKEFGLVRNQSNGLYFKLNKKKFQKINEIVQGRPHLLILHCEFD